jgi:hypothetical protein
MNNLVEKGQGIIFGAQARGFGFALPLLGATLTAIDQC